MIRLKFPDPLQWMDVYSPLEADVLRKAGWVDDDGAELAAKLAALKPVEAVAEKKKPGPKPKG